MSTQTSQPDLSGNKTNVETKQTPPPQYPKEPCRRCGRQGHFTVSCQAKTTVNGYEIESEEEYDSDGHP